MIVGYLIEADGQILLRSDGKGGWVLPSAKSRKAENELKLEGGDALTLLPEETFLYSVFDVADSDPGYLIYRARLAGISAAIPMPPGFRFFPIANLPYDEIPAREICSLLRRYSRERRDESFSIYMDSNDGGRLARLDGTTLPWAQSAQE